MPDREQLVTLTADIVAAHVSNNLVAIGDIGNLVQQVHHALMNLSDGPTEAAPEKRIPVVSARASVKPDHITCMECGKKQRTLKRHLQSAHGLTPQQYRAEFDLPDSYPMTAPSYSEQRKEMAKRIGLGRKPGAGRPRKAGRPPKGA